MTSSMTAFAREQIEIDGMIFCWEIRSVNHRYMDVSFRLPESWRFLENDLRSMLRGQISRGKLECQLKHQDNSGLDKAISINEPLLNALIGTAEKLSGDKHLANDMSLSKVLAWPGIVTIEQPVLEQFSPSILNLFGSTLKQLEQMRATEGAALHSHVLKRLSGLQAEIGKAKTFAEKNALSARDKLLTRLHSLNLEVDNNRLEQELALLLSKMDVTEELDRLTVHVQEVSKSLNAKEPAGRRLDFLMQELNREANTLSSKSDSIELTQSAVEMKVFIEQMREQIQNIE
ncbi:putative stress-induced protein [Legionella birminghamensis]|uniref:Stress-induced protein n=1 Tax=Legionella birminghamensis TaxID=28083 RepID=A0A378IJX7_9GAMM|nr:YicC/YloC family endoribonuclease [Legionella birminghamensis]KTC71708.1 putative stress-induced protein [Legionella birminghamensis]STX32454.1 putative stress-induced protein [Legionella birminghamensis]